LKVFGCHVTFVTSCSVDSGPGCIKKLRVKWEFFFFLATVPRVRKDLLVLSLCFLWPILTNSSSAKNS